MPPGWNVARSPQARRRGSSSILPAADALPAHSREQYFPQAACLRHPRRAQGAAGFGFQDEPDVPATLALAVEHELIRPSDLKEVTYFLSRITLVRSAAPTMPRWQKRLFLTIAHNSANPVEYFGLPIENSISMGAQIQV